MITSGSAMAERFCHLHLHSEYSLLDGVIRIPQIAELCKKTGMEAIALTDHGVMHGAIELLEACRARGVKPIVGCELYVAPGSRRDRDPDRKHLNAHLILLALDDTGYRNLSTLVSLAYREGFYYKPRVDHELLAQHSDGLVALSACLRGELNQCFLADDPARARETAGFYSDVYGPDRYFIELQDHGLADQERVNPRLVDLSRDLGLPLVATNDCHFLAPQDRDIQDVMICIKTGKKLADTRRLHAYTPHHYVKTPEEMATLFRWAPEAIENTARIAEMVTFDPPLDAFHFPEFLPPDGSSPEEFLRKKTNDGLSARFDGTVSEEYASRLKYELDVICDMGFASYFLIVADFVGWAKESDIPVGPGRGSAAGCLVSFALGITDLDPVQYGLLFERFLNPARKSMPDIDIDFDPVGRADVIDYVTRTYGQEHVCQIVTFNRLKARAAIRDVGRVMDIPLGDVDKMAKLLPWGSDLDEAIRKNPEFAKAYNAGDPNKKWIDTARAVEGLARNAGIHAAGVVICADPIWDHAPVQVMEGESGSVCQYSMNDAEKVGLVKMDFLGLRTLSYLRKTSENIKATRGEEIDLLKIPLDDQATFRMLSDGDVLGVFQMEGGGMRDLLMAIAPDRIEDIIATIALFRPGPMENDLHREYARRKNGKAPRTVRHPMLEPILGPTYGVLTYQEQISLILQALGGVDLATATLMMKLISKKRERATIAKYREEFLKGAEERGIDRAVAHDIWNEMEAFAGYGFNKAHSAAYGLIAYQTAYLKANYPLEFYAAYLSSEIHDQDKIGWIVDEMKRKKIPVYPPDVNRSQAHFIVEGEGVRYGLAAIKGVGIQAVVSIASSSEEEGSYEDIYRLVARIDLRLVNKGVLEALVTSGACDSLEGTRRAMLEAIPGALEHGRRQQEDALRGQVALFDPSAGGAGPAPPELEEYPLNELLRMEKQSLGFYLSHHPLEDVWDDIKSSTREGIADLVEMRDGRSVRVGGMIGWISRRLSKKLQNFALFNLEDLTGKVDGIIFPQAYEKYGNLLEPDAFVVIKGRLRIDEKEGGDDEETHPHREVQLVADDVWRFNREAKNEEEQWISRTGTVPEPVVEEDILLEDDVAPYVGAGVHGEKVAVNILLELASLDRSGVASLSAHLASRKGPTPVKLHFPLGNREVVIETGANRRVVYSPELRETLLAIPGVREVSLGEPTRRED